MAEEVRITLKRTDPKDPRKSREALFLVKYQEGMTLQNALQQIYQDQDPSLAYRQFSCNKGICLSCMVSVNGKMRQACTTLLKPADRLSVEAEKGSSLVRDLVTIPKDSGSR